VTAGSPADVDVLVIGAGPAGIAASLGLAERSSASVLLIEAGRTFTSRPCPVDALRKCRGCGGICNVISGLGGSVHYGDGVKLSQFPSGRRLHELLGEAVAGELAGDVLRLLGDHSDWTFRSIEATAAPFPLKAYPVAVLTSDEVKAMVAGLSERLETAPQVNVRLGVEARRIESVGDGFEVRVAPTGRAGRTETVTARRVVAAVGRRGQRWWRAQVRSLGLSYTPPTPSVGLRFECPVDMLAAGAAIHPDFKTTLVESGVKVKTFCFCAGQGGGRIKFTDYGDHTLLDGHVIPEAMDGGLGNFALLAQLRDPLGRPRSHEWVETNLIAPYRRLRADRPGKPVLQWFPDFCSRSLRCASVADFTDRSGFTPSLSDYQMANIAALLPDDIHAAMCAVFERLMAFFAPSGRFDSHGTDAARVGVIGLELEGLWDELDVAASMETSVPGLYACGDCAGIAQGILQAAVSGLAAAADITDSLGVGAGCRR